MKIFENENCSIETVNSILYQTWKGLCNEHEFESAILTRRNLFQTGNFQAIICDTKFSMPISPKMIHWIDKEINPELVANGLKKIAYIMPERGTTKLCIDYLIKNANQSEIESDLFLTPEDALQWIHSEKCECSSCSSLMFP